MKRNKKHWPEYKPDTAISEAEYRKDGTPKCYCGSTHLRRLKKGETTTAYQVRCQVCGVLSTVTKGCIHCGHRGIGKPFLLTLKICVHNTASLQICTDCLEEKHNLYASFDWQESCTVWSLTPTNYGVRIS